MKLITFGVPCYNSAAYMNKCIESLLVAGEEAEIILIDDGSKDETPAIADQWAQQYPGIIRVIHQPNGGHGEGVNQGLANASGLYYKVVDSDDWLDQDSLLALMEKLRRFSHMKKPIDLVICNYVYEHVEDDTRKVIRYKNVFPVNRPFTWRHTKPFLPSQNLLMHSVIYRTQLLRDCGLKLPKHTFYVDNIFVYQPLPWVESMIYFDLDLYRYFIGRADQSVNEKVMMGRMDQQLRVTKIMVDSPDLFNMPPELKKLQKYMKQYLAMMVTICNVFLVLEGSPESLEKREELWQYIRNKDERLYKMLRRTPTCAATSLPGAAGRKLGIWGYRLSQKIFKFN